MFSNVNWDNNNHTKTENAIKEFSTYLSVTEYNKVRKVPNFLISNLDAMSIIEVW